MNPGIYHDISNADYHGGPGISKSGLDLIAKSPAHYFGAYLDPNRPPPDDQTSAQLVGTLAHCAVLEPDEFAKRFKVGPDVNRNTKVWKEFEESLGPGVTAIKPQQYKDAWAQAASLRRLPDIAAALESGRPEVSACWTDRNTGVLCRCRPDWVHTCGNGGVILIDIKTCGDASPSSFRRDIARMRYHVQDSFYSDGFAEAAGCEVLGFVFAAVETEWPFIASAVMIDAEGKEQGRLEYSINLETYARCLESGVWPGYSSQIEQVSLPRWAISS